MSEVLQEKETIVQEIRVALRHTAVYGLGSIVAKAIGFFMLPFYTHYLSPGDYGVLEILDLSMSLFGMLLHMGIAPALLRSHSAAKSPQEKQRIISTAFVFITVTGLLTFAVCFPLVGPVSLALLGPKLPSTYLLLSLSSFVLSYIAAMPRAYLRALEKSGTFTTIDTVALFVTLAMNVYFIAVLDLGPAGILWSSVLVNGIQAVLLAAWTVRRAGISFSGRRLRELAAFGLPLIFSNLALFGLNFSDRFFLQHFQSLAVVGLYAVGYKFAFMINYLLIQPFFVMWQSRMYSIYDRPEHPEIFGQIFVLYSLVLAYAALGLSLFSSELVQVMAGSKYAGSQNVIPVVALAYVIYGLGYYLQLGLYLSGRTKTIGTVSAAAAILNLLANYFLVKQFGMMGAAWATLLGFLAIAAGSYWYANRALPLPLGVARVSVAILLGVGLYAVCPRGDTGSIGFAVAAKVVCLTAYPLILWKARILNAADIGTLSTARERTISGVSRKLGMGAVGR